MLLPETLPKEEQAPLQLWRGRAVHAFLSTLSSPFCMATLTRTRLVDSDVADTSCDLRFGIPSPFPTDELARNRDELLTTEAPLPRTELASQPPPSQEAERNSVQDVLGQTTRSNEAVSTRFRLVSQQVDLYCTGRPLAVDWTSSIHMPGHPERPPFSV